MLRYKNVGCMVDIVETFKRKTLMYNYFFNLFLILS